MNKKKLVTTLGSLALVGAIGVGATLAYLSDTAGDLTNTFVVGNAIDIKLDEKDITKTDNSRTETGNNYVDLQPGIPQPKDPTTTVLADSNDCYVFMRIMGADKFEAKDVNGDGLGDFEILGLDTTNWKKVADIDDLGYVKREGDSIVNTSNKKDGFYAYRVIVENTNSDRSLEPIFTQIQMSADVKNYADDEEGNPLQTNIPDIKITSYAIQSANFETNIEALQALLTELPSTL